MSLATVLARGRVKAEERMVDRCVIRRAGVVLYPDQKCEVAQDPGEAQEEADAYALDLRLVLKVPMSVTGLRLGDEAELTVSAHDPDLVGRKLRIQGLPHETHSTCRRIFCTERTSDMYLRGDADGEWVT